MIVETVSLRDYRSYARLELALDPGLVLVVGPNGAGKTNLLEALHVGTQGFSPRTRSDAQLIRFGEGGARVALGGHRDEAPLSVEVVLRAGAGKQARLNGIALRSAEQLRSDLATLVFTPDRLAVVKGGPAVRRAYVDRALGRLFPARTELPGEYAAAVGQRNAALRRVGLGVSSREALEPWTARTAALGAALAQARSKALALLEPEVAVIGEALRLPGLRLEYRGEALSAQALDDRLDRDLERGATGLGPHLDDVGVLAGGRDLRLYGSQGEQRLAVLALLLGEAAAIADRTGGPPLLLFDDVLSELDPERRRALASLLAGRGQALVTATDASFLPVAPDLLLTVQPGEVTRG
ncbi:MAG: DNA replication/repair protein RecF [Thermoleophilia bacterium]|nr:DNA replication/repair protein RecF [Thermoleophilia bacterium]